MWEYLGASCSSTCLKTKVILLALPIGVLSFSAATGAFPGHVFSWWLFRPDHVAQSHAQLDIGWKTNEWPTMTCSIPHSASPRVWLWKGMRRYVVKTTWRYKQVLPNSRSTKAPTSSKHMQRITGILAAWRFLHLVLYGTWFWSSWYIMSSPGDRYLSLSMFQSVVCHAWEIA